MLVAEPRFQVQLAARCSLYPSPSTSQSSRTGEGQGGWVSLPDGAEGPHFGELEPGKLTPLEEFTPVDWADAHESSLET